MLNKIFRITGRYEERNGDVTVVLESVDPEQWSRVVAICNRASLPGIKISAAPPKEQDQFFVEARLLVPGQKARIHLGASKLSLEIPADGVFEPVSQVRNHFSPHRHERLQRNLERGLTAFQKIVDELSTPQDAEEIAVTAEAVEESSAEAGSQPE